jgi:hypothetical protein
LCFHQVGLNQDPPIYVSHVAGMTGACIHAQLLVEMGGGLVNFLPRLASKYDPPDLCLLSSGNYKH